MVAFTLIDTIQNELLMVEDYVSISDLDESSLLYSKVSKKHYEMVETFTYEGVEVTKYINEVAQEPYFIEYEEMPITILLKIVAMIKRNITKINNLNK